MLASTVPPLSAGRPVREGMITRCGGLDARQYAASATISPRVASPRPRGLHVVRDPARSICPHGRLLNSCPSACNHDRRAQEFGQASGECLLPLCLLGSAYGSRSAAAEEIAADPANDPAMGAPARYGAAALWG